jgi:hypothetical protein
LIFTVAARTTFRCIIPTRSLRPRPAEAHISRTFGCTDTFYSLTTPRWRSQRETSYACNH